MRILPSISATGLLGCLRVAGLSGGLVCGWAFGAAASDRMVLGAAVEVPSGQPLTLVEKRVVEPDNRILYLGFLAPALGGDYGVTFDRASTDMDKICDSVGINEAGKLIGQGVRIDEVVVRLMEREIPYGEVDADAAQFLNAYDISEGKCAWL